MVLNGFELRQRVPAPTRSVIRACLQRFGEATSTSRPLPDFLIIGAQKAGTSALYTYLSHHRQVRPAITKEVHYFDLNFDRGERWYRGHFPRRSDSAWSRRADSITGEATPYYLFHPAVPERVASVVPTAKLIVMLRDPVRRAISQFYHEVALGYETRSLAHAVAAEPPMMEAESARMHDGLEPSHRHQHRSYVSRGLYAEQLSRWLEHVDRTQLCIIAAEGLSRDGGATYRRVLEFLRLPDDGRDAFEQVHRRNYPDPDPAVVAQLRERFREPNAQLKDLLGRERAAEFPWIE
jgi:hypothetical protein